MLVNVKSERNSRNYSTYHPIKKIKYLGINLPNLYSENDKMLMKEIKEDTNRWKDIEYPWIGKIKMIKITKLPKAIYRVYEIPIK